MVNTPPFSASGQNLAPAALRIAMVAPPWFAVPPRGYGGTETVIANLVEGLVARGHHVSLFASGEPGTSAQSFTQIFEEPPSELIGDPLPEYIAAVDVERHLAELDVDVIHDHSMAGPLNARNRAVPTVVTVHGPSDGYSGEYFARLGTDVSAVAISLAQRRRNPEINWLATVHNAVDVGSFTADRPKEDFVLWLGRFSPDKAPELAIKAARERGRRIVLAGKCAEPAEKEFFARVVRPLLGSDAEFVGEADASLKRELLSRASALVFPIQWDEPFGMVMVEALASGTPVVAFNRGSVPEVVRHGTTGTIATTWDEFCNGIDTAFELDPAACREDAATRFDLPAMADSYARAFAKLPGVNSAGGPSSQSANPVQPGHLEATRVA
jgi:glycosyltransferase involved in cell wall biosynthesis